MVNEKETTMNMNMRKQQGKVYDVMEHPRKQMNKKVHVSAPLQPTRLPKPVDEDLYKIPPELLRTTKRVGHFFYFILLLYVVFCELCYP
jgi:hypothetical protein